MDVFDLTFILEKSSSESSKPDNNSAHGSSLSNQSINRTFNPTGNLLKDNARIFS
jgi:hypothetical protein